MAGQAMCSHQMSQGLNISEYFLKTLSASQGPPSQNYVYFQYELQRETLMLLISFLKHRCCGSMEVRVMPGAGPGFRTASPRALPRDNHLQLLKRGPPDPHLGKISTNEI